MHREAKTNDVPCVFKRCQRSRLFELLAAKRSVQDCPKTPQTAQEGPKLAQEASKTAQEGHNNSPRRAPRGRTRTDFSSSPPQDAPRRLRDAPQRLQEAPRKPQQAPIMPQNFPPGCPREPSEEIPRSIPADSDPLPRHGGGIGRWPLDDSNTVAIMKNSFEQLPWGWHAGATQQHAAVGLETALNSRAAQDLTTWALGRSKSCRVSRGACYKRAPAAFPRQNRARPSSPKVDLKLLGPKGC